MVNEVPGSKSKYNIAFLKVSYINSFKFFKIDNNKNLKKIENLEQTETNQSSITNVNIIPQNHEIHQELIKKNEITTNPKLNEIEKIIGKEENSIQKKKKNHLLIILLLVKFM